MNILVPNFGSTSVKYQILEMPGERVLAKASFERVSDYREAIAKIRTAGVPVDAVAFKTVHGGPEYRETFVIDEGVVAALEKFLPAAPVHNAVYLAAIRAFREMLPGVPLVAAFETEFHRTMPERAAVYGVPAAWRGEGIARYGFHGASHQCVSERVETLMRRSKTELRLVSCHLGGSSSMCAIERGRSIDTTMGFSPQSGLENATRHGDLDVFAVLYLMEKHGWTAEEVRRQLAGAGGLAGISGVAGGDVRDLDEAARNGNGRAALALEMFAYQVRKTIGAYAAAMGGLDAVAFTGGIGEHSARLRAECCAGLEFLGIWLDPARNTQATGDRVISADGSPATVLALTTNEELIVARRAYARLDPDAVPESFGILGVSRLTS
ncbi:MAG TPA: acetate/propionate family kinase [Bryobacteraceae bacterium]|nr:acetate/propionate family kinase [Bryobacteraceae bacterium]